MRNYNVIMKAKALKSKLVQIGNSRGIRLPKTVIEQAGLCDDVEIAVRENEVVIRPADGNAPRAGWERAFKLAIAKHGRPKPMDADLENLSNEFDDKEWNW